MIRIILIRVAVQVMLDDTSILNKCYSSKTLPYERNFDQLQILFIWLFILISTFHQMPFSSIDIILIVCIAQV